MSDVKRFADELTRMLRVRAQEYMTLAETNDDPRRERVITRAVAFSEIADLVALAAKETLT